MDIDDGFRGGRGRGRGRGGQSGRGGGGDNRPLCRFFQQGTCRKGNQCDFSHGHGGGRSHGGGGRNQHQQHHQQQQFQNGDGQAPAGVCTHFYKFGNCKFGNDCRYSHEGPAGTFNSNPLPNTHLPSFDAAPFGGDGGMAGAFSPPQATPFGITGAFSPPQATPFGITGAFSPPQATPFGGVSVFASPQPVTPAQPIISSSTINTATFDSIAKDFIKFYFEKFQLERTALKSLMRDATYLTFGFNEVQEKQVGADPIILYYQQRIPNITSYQVNKMEVHPTVPSGSILILICGDMDLGAQYGFSMSFILVPVQGEANKYWISNIMKRFFTK